MKDILIIAPYGELYNMCCDVVERKEYQNVEVIMADTDGKVNIEKLIFEKDPMVVISRGGVYNKIKTLFSSIAMVEMQISAYDTINTLKEVIDLDEAVAVLGTENITYGFELLQGIKKVSVKKVNRDTGESLINAIDDCVKNGIKIFVGDTRVSKVCDEMGYKCYLIKSGESSVISAINKAVEILRVTKEQMENNKRYVSLIDCVHDGVIATDEDNKIVAYNNVAQGILDIDKYNFIGKTLGEAFKNNTNSVFLKNNEPVFDQLCKLNNVRVTLTKIPIMVRGESKGMVSVFQDVKKLQKLEVKVRSQLLGKGFVAKYTFKDIIHKSDIMESTIKKAEKFSQYDSAILIQGSSGVGKELFAQSIHNSSKRQKGPFVALNCGALPESIIESELFGYEEGAFTGSKKGGKAGLFEMAHRGTIFLDEISEMPINIQSQLLRVIQEREVMRLGDSKVIPLDIRIICASNKNLKQMVENEKFREDLFFRINTLSFSIPLLKDRGEDIELLSKYYIEKYNQLYSKHIEGFTERAKKYLYNSQYRGNVRELQNMIERAVILCDGNLIDAEDFDDDIVKGCNSEAKTVKNAEEKIYSENISLKDMENKYINYVFEREGGSVKKVCEILKIDRSTLWRKLKEKQ